MSRKKSLKLVPKIATKLKTEGVTHDNFNTDKNLSILKKCVAPNILTKTYLVNESAIKTLL